MLAIHAERIVARLQQIVSELENACDMGIDYYDCLREFKSYCEETPTLAQLITQLPKVKYDFNVDWREMPSRWLGGRESYAMRWDGICQMVEGGETKVEFAWLQLNVDTYNSQQHGLRKLTEIFVIPIAHFLIHQLIGGSAILHVLLRYKRWAEWFQADNLREMYEIGSDNGEGVLDENLRRFLFENGIDYPFSQPASPRGRVDVAAQLETDDPLVLEIKIWDSNKGYKEGRIRDGLRQVMDYSAKYGKDRGHVIVFNLDQEPLVFVNAVAKDEWPARIEYGGKIYFFIDVHIAKKLKPISQQDKGKLVRVNEIDLSMLLNAI